MCRPAASAAQVSLSWWTHPDTCRYNLLDWLMPLKNTPNFLGKVCRGHNGRSLALMSFAGCVTMLLAAFLMEKRTQQDQPEEQLGPLAKAPGLLKPSSACVLHTTAGSCEPVHPGPHHAVHCVLLEPCLHRWVRWWGKAMLVSTGLTSKAPWRMRASHGTLGKLKVACSFKDISISRHMGASS